MDEINGKLKDGLDCRINSESEEARAEDSAASAQIHEARSVSKRSSAGLWVCFLALAVALLAVAGYDYSILREHNSELAKLPDIMIRLTRIGARVDGAEAKLQAWIADRDALAQRVAVLDRKVSSTLRIARRQTQELITQAQSRIEQELDKRTKVIDARLTQFQADQQAQETRLAQLQEEVASVRQEVAAFRRDTERESASLEQQQAQSQAKLETIAKQLDRRRIDFELARNETRELTPEISLRVTWTDARYQRYDGWMWYEPDRRFLWITDQGVQQPVALRPKQGGEPYELVVTTANKNSVTGYLFVPGASRSGTTVSTAADREAPLTSRAAF